MSKLIIPAAEIIGTPLTTEELKGILAGYSITKVCTCSYERSGPVDEYGNTPHYTQVISAPSWRGHHEARSCYHPKFCNTPSAMTNCTAI